MYRLLPRKKNKIIWNIHSKSKKKIIKNSKIVNIKFYQRYIKLVPSCCIHFYNKYIRNKNKHTAFHSFIIITLNCDTELFIEYDGYINIFNNSKRFVEKKEILLLELKSVDLDFNNVYSKLKKYKLDYSIYKNNCKHFCEVFLSYVSQDPIINDYIKIKHNEYEN